jgi:hypothetical protein
MTPKNRITVRTDLIDKAIERIERTLDNYRDDGFKKEHKSRAGGLTEAGRRAYHRETGGTLRAPTKDPNNRRHKSFCARMKGAKKKLTSKETANDPDSRINKSLRRWGCH